MVSPIFQINLRELIKGFFIAFLGALAMAVKAFTVSGSIPVTWPEWQTILLSGLSAGVLYVIATVITGPGAAANSEKQKVPEMA
jgi:hypothetical protein